MNLQRWKGITSKFVGTGPSSYKKRIYWAAVSQMLRNTCLGYHLRPVRHGRPYQKLRYRRRSPQDNTNTIFKTICVWKCGLEKVASAQSVWAGCVA